MNSTEQPSTLLGETIIWTGSKGSARDLLSSLMEKGAKVEHHPLIAIAAPADSRQMDAVGQQLSRFAWILFTSQHAARAVASWPLPSLQTRIAAVGASTASELARNGWSVDWVPKDKNAAALADGIITRGPAAAPLLFVRGSRAMRTAPDRLKTAGFKVEEIEVYTSNPISSEKARRVAERIVEVASLVIMGSPSGVETLAKSMLPERLVHLKKELIWCCLGQTTRQALERYGIKEVLMPKSGSPSSLVMDIEYCLKKQSLL